MYTMYVYCIFCVNSVQLFDSNFNLIDTARVNIKVGAACLCFGICGCVVNTYRNIHVHCRSPQCMYMNLFVSWFTHIQCTCTCTRTRYAYVHVYLRKMCGLNSHPCIDYTYSVMMTRRGSKIAHLMGHPPYTSLAQLA